MSFKKLLTASCRYLSNQTSNNCLRLFDCQRITWQLTINTVCYSRGIMSNKEPTIFIDKSSSNGNLWELSKMSEPYEKLLQSTFQNALLHLYVTCSEGAGYVPLKRRNEILIRFLKKGRADKFKVLKKEITRMLHIGRSGHDMEACIKSLLASVKSTDFKVDRMVELVNVLERYANDGNGVFYDIAEDGAANAVNTIKIHRHTIETAFDDEGNNVKPILIEFVAANDSVAEKFILNFPERYRVVESSIEAATAKLSLMISA